jgi:hypothetical protein
MRARYRSVIAVFSAAFAAACSIIPDLPPDFALPVQEILLQSACELQEALQELDTPEYKRFKARQWLVAVSLTPKVDTDLAPGVGGTRKVPTTPNATRLTTWVIGTMPGLQADFKGTRTGGITFNFKSANLIDDKHLPCDMATPTVHELAQYLGVGRWLRRTADAVNITPSGEIDRPSYNSEINIKFTAAGSWTYTFPPGTNFATLTSSYTLDEQLNILMTAVEDKKTVTAITLPRGDNFDKLPDASKLVTSTVTLESAKARLDTLQLEQAIRSLRFPIQ